MVTALSLAIVAQALLRAVLTYGYNMATVRLTQGKIVPDLRDKLYARLQRLSFRFFEVNGSSSIFNRLTGDVQNTRLFVDGVILQGLNMLITLVAYFVFMWKIHHALTLAVSFGHHPARVGHALLFEPAAAGLPAESRSCTTTSSSISPRAFSESRPSKASPRNLIASRGLKRETNQAVSAQQQKIFWDLSLFTPVDPISFAIEPRHPFCLWRLALCPRPDSVGRRAGGVCGFAAAIHRAGGQPFDHRQFRATEPDGRTARFRGARHAVGSPEQTGAIAPGRLTGKIVFDRVTFGYDAEMPVLARSHFEAKPGQVIGIFGMTGAGKSSLLEPDPAILRSATGTNPRG